MEEQNKESGVTKDWLPAQMRDAEAEPGTGGADEWPQPPPAVTVDEDAPGGRTEEWLPPGMRNREAESGTGDADEWPGAAAGDSDDERAAGDDSAGTENDEAPASADVEAADSEAVEPPSASGGPAAPTTEQVEAIEIAASVALEEATEMIAAECRKRIDAELKDLGDQARLRLDAIAEEQREARSDELAQATDIDENRAEIDASIEALQVQVEQELQAFSRAVEGSDASARRAIDAFADRLETMEKSHERNRGGMQSSATDQGTSAAPRHGLAGLRKVNTDPTEKVEPVGVNDATFEQLRGLGMSATQAARLISVRDIQGGFGSHDDLDLVPGLSDKLKADLRVNLTL